MLNSETRRLRLLRFMTWNLASTSMVPPLVKPTKVTFTSGAVLAAECKKASIAIDSTTSTQAKINSDFRIGSFNHHGGRPQWRSFTDRSPETRLQFRA